MRVRSTWLLLAALGCGSPRAADHMRTEASFLRVGVDRDAELSQVKRVLAQRGLHAVAERYSLAYVAIGAASEQNRATAIRVISSRGVAFADDASLDDLFAPAHLELLDTLPDTLDDMELFAYSRIAQGHTLGCVTVGRVLPDGAAVPFRLDVTQLGDQACVSALRHVGRGNLLATVSWPRFSQPESPAAIEVMLALDRPRLDQPAALVRGARLEANAELIEREAQRLSSLPSQPTFGQRQALALGRAALSLLRGESKEAQLGAYREALGAVRPGSREFGLAEYTMAHIGRGWIDQETQSEAAGDADAVDAKSEQNPRGDAAQEGELVIEPDSPVPASQAPELAPAPEGH